MLYTIRHITNFIYDTAVTESVMEARMQARTDATQRCIQFRFSTTPSSRVIRYHDHEGNIVHHFNIPGRHSRLVIDAEALVECHAPSPLPVALEPGGWERLDAVTASGDFWDVLAPSTFTGRTPALDRLAAEIGVARGEDPLATAQRLMQEIYARFVYAPRTTRVDSPIDEALAARSGVCQDFAHIYIALARPLGLPCRYVSGYLFSQPDNATRSADGATHAWVETWLPETGWVGRDPTNNLVTGEHHVRVAVGRDYSDVPPTRGVFKGTSGVRSELAVGVSIGSAAARPDREPVSFVPWTSQHVSDSRVHADAAQQQQQQQQ